MTVLDLKSSVAQLTIDTPIEVCGLRPIENTIAVIGYEKVIAWNLPKENVLPIARMDVKDSTRTINFSNTDNRIVTAASISADFRYIALKGVGGGEEVLDVYCTSTGRNLRVTVSALALWFAPGGHDIWCVTRNKAMVFTIAHDALDHTKTVVDIEDGSWGCPWGSSHGYKVTYHGWILGAGGRRLLVLPPLWQSLFKVDRVWSGKFLALLHGSLPDPVILELEP